MTRSGPGRRGEPDRDRFLRRGAVGAGLAVAVAAAALTGCAEDNGTALARQACTKVADSIALYRSSLTQSDPARAGQQQAQAMTQLRDAMPTAAAAAGEDGQYQALMATLAESDHLPESLLVHALTAQCAAADSPTGAGTGTGTGTGAGPTSTSGVPTTTTPSS